ncbi:MAG: hypothetical protein ACE5FQ_04470 [Thiogranum sp.]
MSATPCHDECTYLIKLASRLEKSMTEEDGQMKGWYNKINTLLRSPDLESLKGERGLENLSLQLRTIWLRYASYISSRYLKSPPHFQVVHLPSGEKNPFPYERWNQPASLEQRAATYRHAPAGWKADHIIFNSGMGAVTCLLQVIRKLFEPKPGNPLSFHGVGGYFEIMDLMQFTHDELYRFRIFQDQKQFQHSVARGESPLVYIEPVFTLLGRLEVFDMDSFIAAWRQRPDSVPTAIVLDTTFVGNRFPVQEFLERLAPHKPRVVIQISSTLKLDQEGLEFSNAGLMSIFSTTEPIVNGIARRMRKYRAAMGLGLTLEQTAALDYPGFLDTDLCDRHSAGVFKNNARLARKLEVGDNLLFIARFHPVLQENHQSTPWAVAPFVNLQLRSETDQHERELLKHVIFKEASQRGLTFKPGSSFGFRAHRVETSIQDERGGVQVIRVAMGCREGPSAEGTIHLLNDISHMRTFDNIKSRYPELMETIRKFEEL